MTTLVIEAAALGVLTGGAYALMASGLTLVFGVMRIINVGQGALVVLGAYLSLVLLRRWGVDPFLGLVVTLPAMFLLGVAIEVVFIRPLRTDREALSALIEAASPPYLARYADTRCSFPDVFASGHQPAGTMIPSVALLPTLSENCEPWSGPAVSTSDRGLYRCCWNVLTKAMASGSIVPRTTTSAPECAAARAIGLVSGDSPGKTL